MQINVSPICHYVLNDATVCMNALLVLYNNYNISQIIGLVESTLNSMFTILLSPGLVSCYGSVQCEIVFVPKIGVAS